MKSRPKISLIKDVKTLLLPNMNLDQATCKVLLLWRNLKTIEIHCSLTLLVNKMHKIKVEES